MALSPAKQDGVNVTYTDAADSDSTVDDACHHTHYDIHQQTHQNYIVNRESLKQLRVITMAISSVYTGTNRPYKDIIPEVFGYNFV